MFVQESAELSKFREQWREEVRRRREEQHPEQLHLQPSPSESRVVPPETGPKPPAKWSVAPPPRPSLHTSHGQRPLTGSIARAVDLYRSAVQHEQESDLDEALRLYRQAFRLNPDVDSAYFKEEERLHRPAPATKSATAHGIEGNDRHAPRAPQNKAPVHTHGVLAKLLGKFPPVLTFEPEDDRERVPINMIPEELLLYILRNLDTTALERFATVSRKARVVSLDPSIWREFVCMAYKPPQIPQATELQTIVDRYDADYRQTYIHHPRLRLDGVYIAVCHYIRRGLGENAWVNVSHLITFHRYLRFFPDGQVLSLLANEEHPPALVIPMLKPSLRMKGFYVGEWRLEDSTVLITNLVERHAHPAHHNHAHVPSPQTRYRFQMTLTLRSKPLGRWNKLDLVSYESVNAEDGEVVALPLKHQRPFWFSKVKSWQGY